MRTFRFFFVASALALAACPADDSAGDTDDGTEGSSGTDTTTTGTGTSTTTTDATTTSGTGTSTTGTTGSSGTTDDSATSGSTGGSTGDGSTGDGSTGGSSGGTVAEACFMIQTEMECDAASNCEWFGQGQLGVCGDSGNGGGICSFLTMMQICETVPGCNWNAGNMTCEGA